MRRKRPAFHLWVPHPPVPIVVDQTGVHKRIPCMKSAISHGPISGGAPISAFCYDVVVWKHLTVRNGREFVKHIVPAVLKPARTLWNEVIGFVFMCFAVVFGFKSVRLYLDSTRGSGEAASADFVRFLVAALCTVLMLWFGVTSFLRARKISRS